MSFKDVRGDLDPVGDGRFHESEALRGYLNSYARMARRAAVRRVVWRELTERIEAAGVGPVWLGPLAWVDELGVALPSTLATYARARLRELQF